MSPMGAPSSGDRMLAGAISVVAVILVAVGGLGLMGKFSILKDETNALNAQVAATPDVVLETYACDAGGFEWRVMEHDEVQGGGHAGGGGSILTLRSLGLYKNGTLVQEIKERNNETANRNFPVADNYLKAYVVNRNVFNTGDATGQYWNDKYYKELRFYVSETSQTDFEAIANCTKKYLAQLDEGIKQGQYPRSIGWLILMESLDRTQVNGSIAYACDDDRTAIIAGGRHIFYYPASAKTKGVSAGTSYTQGGWVTLDGKVHEREVYDLLSGGGVDPASVIPHCVDSTGISLVEQIKGVPSRVEYFE